MSLHKATRPSTADYLALASRLKSEIAQADAIVIGAGAGLSAAAGLTYSGPRFQENFADFIDKYHYEDMYSAGFYPYPSKEEFWAYWSRYIWLNRYGKDDDTLHKELLTLVGDKNYFVLTTNVDGCFEKAGFDKQRLFYTQGDYGLLQCSEPCHQETYNNKDLVKRMVLEQKNMRIPTELIPQCSKCGKPMTTNLRSDDTFVENAGWHNAADRYHSFVQQHLNQHILFLELGVGGNTPVIIKYPFWNMTYYNKNAVYACINMNEAMAPKEIQDRAICINEDIHKVIRDILG